MIYISRFAIGVLALAYLASGQTKLDINRLYRLPWIIGTAPKDFVWSAESKRLAFLWNDEGTNFYDVWVADKDSGKPVRVTHMPRPESPMDAGVDVEKLQQVGRAETDTGVTAVAWSPDQKRLLFLLKGQLYIVRPGGAPSLVVNRSDVKAVKPAPQGDLVAFVAGVNLFVVSDKDGAQPRQLTAITLPQSSVEDFYWSNNSSTLAFIESDESEMPVRGIPDYLGEETVLRSVKRPFPGEPSEKRRLGFVSARGDASIRWADLGGDPMDLIFGVDWSPDDRTVLVDRSVFILRIGVFC